MKNFKIVLTCLLAVASIIGFSSFVSHSYKAKAFDTTCFTYDDNAAQTEQAIETAGNYATEDQATVAALCPNETRNICGICVSDAAGLSGGLPNSDVLTGVWTNRNNTFEPNHTVVFIVHTGGVDVTVTIYFKPA